MSDYDIEYAAERAAQKLIRNNLPDWLAGSNGDPDRVLCGMENRDTEVNEGEESSIIRLPCVRCICFEAAPVLPNFHGNWNATLRIETEDNTSDIEGASFAARVRQITRLFLTTTIADDLSKATPEFYVAKVAPGNRGYSFTGNSWVHHQEYSLLSACSIPT